MKVWKSGFWVSFKYGVMYDVSMDIWEVEVTKMTSSHRAGVLFTPVKKTVGRTVRRDSMSIRIRDLKSYTVFHGDSENISFM